MREQRADMIRIAHRSTTTFNNGDLTMRTQKQGQKAAGWLASLIGLLLVFGVVWFGFNSSSAAGQDGVISPAAIQDGFGPRLTFSRFREHEKDTLFEGYWVNQRPTPVNVQAKFSLVEMDRETWKVLQVKDTWQKEYYAPADNVEFFGWKPNFQIPATQEQFKFWIMVDYCVDGGECTQTGRAIFDERLDPDKWGTLTSIIELSQSPTDACKVEARYKLYTDPSTDLYNMKSGELVHHEDLTFVEPNGWTNWSQKVALDEGTYRLVAKAPEGSNVRDIEEMIQVKTPLCPPKTATPTATATSTATSTATQTATPTATASQTPVSQGCEYLKVTPSTGKAPLVITLELKGFGVAMEGGEVRGNNGMVIPVQNSVAQSLVVTESVHFVGTLYDGGKPFTAKQCEADVIVTTEEKTPTPQAPAKVFLPGIRNDATPTPTVPPTPTATPEAPKVQGRACGDPYWKSLDPNKGWSALYDDCGNTEYRGEKYPELNDRPGQGSFVNSLTSFEDGWAVFTYIKKFEIGSTDAESILYAILSNGHEQLAITNLGLAGNGDPGEIQVFYNNIPAQLTENVVTEMAGWKVLKYNISALKHEWKGVIMQKGDTTLLFIQERHNNLRTGWVEYITPLNPWLEGYWPDAHRLGRLPQNIGDYVVTDVMQGAAINPAAVVAAAVAAAQH